MSDRTPIESIPLKEGKHAQFVQLVTHRVSVWHEEHSTKNPYGVIPDSEITRVIRANSE